LGTKTEHKKLKEINSKILITNNNIDKNTHFEKKKNCLQEHDFRGKLISHEYNDFKKKYHTTFSNSTQCENKTRTKCKRKVL
jgi:hypothetical protein